jgi:hypothetical protein
MTLQVLLRLRNTRGGPAGWIGLAFGTLLATFNGLESCRAGAAMARRRSR